MSIFSQILIVLITLEFFYIFYLETLATSSTQTSKVFNLEPEELKKGQCEYLTKKLRSL